MWKIEVWVKAAKRWKPIGEVEGYDKAKEAVCALAQEGHVAQATLPDATPNEYHGLRAFPGRGWFAWTGSGGFLG